MNQLKTHTKPFFPFYQRNKENTAQLKHSTYLKHTSSYHHKSYSKQQGAEQYISQDI